MPSEFLTEFSEEYNLSSGAKLTPDLCFQMWYHASIPIQYLLKSKSIKIKTLVP